MLFVAASGEYCYQHPGATRCSPNSFPADLASFLIVAAIVGLVIFNWMWKRRARKRSR